MKSIANRIILFIAGLMLAWCSVWGSSKWMQSSVADMLMILLCIVAAVAGIIVFCAFIAESNCAKPDFDSTEAIVSTSIGAISFSFLFGVLVAPIGNGVWAWVTPWDFLLVLGFVPVAIVGKELVAQTSGAVHP